MPSSEADRDLVRRIRNGDETAWQQCIDEYEGRLQAFVFSRLRDRSLAEDLVQETFLGFLTALPNFDESTPLESFLFAIAAHKITDALRRQGRRPVFPLQPHSESGPAFDLPGAQRMASSMARSRERKGTEAAIVADCLQDLISQWRSRGEFERLKCVELLFVKGLPNKLAAEQLGITEQDVANHKYFTVSKLKDAAKQARISLSDPELQQ